MPTPTRRLMTQEEKQRILSLIEPNRSSASNWRAGVNLLAFLVIAIFWVALVCLLVAIHFPPKLANVLMKATPLAAFAASLLFYYKVLCPWTPRALVSRSRYARDVADGQVEVYHYTATQAVHLIESASNDNGGIIEEMFSMCGESRDGFYLDIGGGQLLFLTGPYLTNLVTNQRFPCQEFNVIRLPHAGETLSIDILGQPLDPHCHHVLFQANGDFIMDDFTEITANLDMIEERLRKR